VYTTQRRLTTACVEASIPAIYTKTARLSYAFLEIAPKIPPRSTIRRRVREETWID
jgi:hypothetical protein